MLGLEDLTDAQKLLQEARLARQHQVDEVAERLDPLLTRLQEIVDAAADGRASAMLKALGGKHPDLAAASELLREGSAVTADPVINLLRQSQGLAAPAAGLVDYAARELLAAEEELVRVAGTDAARARALAALLEQALAVHAHHDGADCPVCGAEDRLTPAWRESTTREVDEAPCSSADGRPGAHARGRSAQGV